MFIVLERVSIGLERVFTLPAVYYQTDSGMQRTIRLRFIMAEDGESLFGEKVVVGGEDVRVSWWHEFFFRG